MVHQIKRILYTTDLSESSIAVFEQTVGLAAQTGASIVMLHVIEDGSSGQQNRLIHLVDKTAYEKIRQESQEMIKHVLIGKQRTIPLIQNALKELCDKTSEKICGADNPVVIDGIEVKYGNVAEAVLEVCETAGCDLVALGYYQKGSLLKALMGGHGKSVIQQSKKPVFLVPLEA
jgi:nucleotide-binding universal stress UspA family protein